VRIPAIRALLARTTMVLLSVFVGIMLAEGVLRTAADRILHTGEYLAIGKVYQVDDPLLGYSPIPGATRIAAKGDAFLVRERINAAGLRDIDHPIARTPGMKRILVLGDSFMYGEGVTIPETMPRRLAGLLPGTEVINAGVRGYDLGQEYLYYKHRLHSYRPDLVLLAFFMNDLAPDQTMESVEGPDGLPLLYRARPETLARAKESDGGGLRVFVSSRLRNHSMLYVLLRQRLDDFRARRLRAGTLPQDTPADLPYVAAFELWAPGTPMPEAWKRAYRILDALKNESETHGARLAVIMIPAPWQISEENWNQWVTWLRRDPATLSRRRPSDMVLGWCEMSGTPCLDLLPAFENGDRRQLYFQNDHHWNVEGHVLASREVVAFLTTAGLP